MNVAEIEEVEKAVFLVISMMGARNPRVAHLFLHVKDERVRKKNFKHLCRLANRYMANTEPFKSHKIKIKGV